MLEDKVNYKITKGLVFMLMGMTGHSKKQVWTGLAEITQVCVNRIKKKSSQRESWRHFQYPNTDITMKVKVRERGGQTRRWTGNGWEYVEVPVNYSAEIFLNKTDNESFTSQEVADFLIEEVLLGE